MSPAPETHGTAWSRLTKNAEQNQDVFRAASLSPDRVATIRCGRCDCAEQAYFWTVREHSGDRLKLECPSCEEYSTGYSLSGNRAATPAGERLGAHVRYAAAPVLVIGGLAVLLALHAPARERLITLAYDLDRTLLSASSGAAGRVEGNTAGLPGGAVLARVPGSGGSSAAGSSSDTAGEREFVRIADGDRRDQVSTLAEAISARTGTDAMASVREVRFIPELGQTRVRVDFSAAEWLTALSEASGWR